jgi:hypothetical protein
MAMDGDGRQWMAQLQLNIKGRRDGESTAMGNEEWCKRDDNVGTAGGGSDKGQRGIKM